MAHGLIDIINNRMNDKWGLILIHENTRSRLGRLHPVSAVVDVNIDIAVERSNVVVSVGFILVAVAITVGIGNILILRGLVFRTLLLLLFLTLQPLQQRIDDLHTPPTCQIGSLENCHLIIIIILLVPMLLISIAVIGMSIAVLVDTGFWMTPPPSPLSHIIQPRK